MTKYQGTEVDQVDLDELDITVHKVLELGIIAEAGMQIRGITGSEDFSDWFDSIGVLLRYASAKMLWEVYKDDADMVGGYDFFVKPPLVEETKESIISLDSFNMGLVERLVK